MTDKRIEPALTPEEWARRDAGQQFMRRLGIGGLQWNATLHGYTMEHGSTLYGADAPALIALLNAALPDSDPRKLDDGHVSLLRVAASIVGEHSEDDRPEYRDTEWTRHARRDALNALADVIASYLPPEER